MKKSKIPLILFLSVFLLSVVSLGVLPAQVTLLWSAQMVPLQTGSKLLLAAIPLVCAALLLILRCRRATPQSRKLILEGGTVVILLAQIFELVANTR